MKGCRRQHLNLGGSIWEVEDQTEEAVQKRMTKVQVLQRGQGLGLDLAVPHTYRVRTTENLSTKVSIPPRVLEWYPRTTLARLNTQPGCQEPCRGAKGNAICDIL